MSAAPDSSQSKIIAEMDCAMVNRGDRRPFCLRAPRRDQPAADDAMVRKLEATPPELMAAVAQTRSDGSTSGGAFEGGAAKPAFGGAGEALGREHAAGRRYQRLLRRQSQGGPLRCR